MCAHLKIDSRCGPLFLLRSFRHLGWAMKEINWFWPPREEKGENPLMGFGGFRRPCQISQGKKSIAVATRFRSLANEWTLFSQISWWMEGKKNKLVITFFAHSALIPPLKLAENNGHSFSKLKWCQNNKGVSAQPAKMWSRWGQKWN